MNKIFTLVFIILFLTNCSFNSKSKFWTNEEKIQVDKDLKVTEIFKKETIFEKELNPQLEIKLSDKIIQDSFINNLNNNNGRTNYNGSLKKSSRFKFVKIDKFDFAEPEIAFDKNNLIFFDNKGSILKFDNSSKLIWKKNFYKKYEKKFKPLLSFANNNEILIVTDNLSKFYAININSGELLWDKRNSSPFNSQIKIYNDKFFAVDFDNILRCYSIFDGKEYFMYTSI